MILSNRAKIGIAVVLIFAALGIAVLAFKEQVGKFAWEIFRLDRVAAFLNSNDAAMHFKMGNFYFNGGAYDLERAKKYFAKTISLDERLPGAHYQLGRIYFLEGKFFSALEEMNKEIELYPEFEKSYYMSGLIAGYQGNFNLAVRSFEKFLTFKPESWAGWNDLAWVYFKKGDYEKVKEAAENGIAAAGENVWLNTSLGVALLNLEENSRAVAVLNQAKIMAENMTPEEWGMAYPGNNPKNYEDGLRQMLEAIEFNLNLAMNSVDNF